MKNRKFVLKRPPIGVSWGLGVYAVTLFLLILLAQILIDPFTHALVLLCLCMPFASVLSLFIAMIFVKAETGDGMAETARNKRATVSVNIKNCGILPISVATAVYSLPDEKGGRSVTKAKKKISLPPYSTVNLKAEPMAYRRGRFEVGVSEIWLYDLLRLIKIRKRIKGVYTLAVLPMMNDQGADIPDDGSIEEDASVTLDVSSSYDYGDVREYRPGDAMKRIHWKLSSKSEELQVKKSVSQKESYTCIVCDRSVDGGAFRLPKSIRYEIDDRTVEEAMYAVSEICRNDGNGCLSVTTDDGNAFLLSFGGVSDEIQMRHLLSDLERGEAGDAPSLIPEGVTAVYYILSYLSPEQAKGVFDALRNGAVQTFNVCIRDVSAMIPEAKRDDYRVSLEAFKMLLSENGVSFFTVTEGGATNEE